MNSISVKLTKKQQIEQRRSLILELSSQGMTQEKISEVLKPDVLKISQAVVSRDLQYLNKNAIEYVRKNREQMVTEYRRTYTNLQTLRRDVFEYYRKAKEEGNKNLVLELIPIIESIETSIHQIVSAGYQIEAELIHYGKEQNDEINEQVGKALTAHGKTKL